MNGVDLELAEFLGIQPSAVLCFGYYTQKMDISPPRDSQAPLQHEKYYFLDGSIIIRVSSYLFWGYDMTRLLKTRNTIFLV